MRVVKTTDYDKPLQGKKGQKLEVIFYGKKIMEYNIKKPLTVDRCTVIALSEKDKRFGFKKGLGVLLGEKQEEVS